MGLHVDRSALSIHVRRVLATDGDATKFTSQTSRCVERRCRNVQNHVVSEITHCCSSCHITLAVKKMWVPQLVDPPDHECMAKWPNVSDTCLYMHVYVCVCLSQVTSLNNTKLHAANWTQHWANITRQRRSLHGSLLSLASQTFGHFTIHSSMVLKMQSKFGVTHGWSKV